MKITAIDTSTTPATRVVLADHWSKPVIAYHERPGFAWELQDGTRWDNADPVDRANVRTTISFTVTYSLDSIPQAEVELHDLRDRTPRIARIELESASDTERRIRYIANAATEITDLSYEGLSIYVSYQITGGAIVSSV